MNSATLKDDYLHINSQAYSSYKGRYMHTTIIPIEDIECIKASVGKQGGMHTWSVKGYNAEYSNSSYNKGKERDIDIFSGDRKNSELIDEIRELLPKLKYKEKVETGGAPW